MQTLVNMSPLIGLTGSMFSTGISTGAAYQTALASNYSKQWNAQQAEYAAEIATAKANVFRQLGETEKFETLQKYDALRSQQRAEYSAAGVNVNVGSAMTQQVATTKTGVYEAQKAKYERDLQAWEMDVEARNQLLTAEMNRNSQSNPWLPAVSAAVGGLSGTLLQYGQWQRQSSTGTVSETSSYFTMG